MKKLILLLLPLFSFGSVHIDKPKAYQVFQRENRQGTIQISGTCNGNLVVEWNGIEQDATITGNTFTASIQSGQGQHTLYAICGSEIDSVQYIGIGDVYLTIGQSNMVGYSNYSQVYTPPLFNQNLKASVFYNNVWKLADDITCEGSLGGSMIPLLASKLVNKDSIPVAFITAAHNGTDLVYPPDWKPNNNAYYLVMKHIVDYSGVDKIKVVLCQNGEGDALYNVTENDFYNGLIELADSINNNVVGNPKTMVATVVTINGYEDRTVPIRQAQINSWNAENILQGAQSHLINHIDYLHIQTNEELEQLAQLWFEAINSEEIITFVQPIEKPKIKYGFKTIEELENFITGRK